MAEYIEREAAVEALDVAERFLRTRIPAADVVPVVRCKDCKFACDFDDDESAWCKNWNQYVWAEHFCSYGERKDGDGNG